MLSLMLHLSALQSSVKFPLPIYVQLMSSLCPAYVQLMSETGHYLPIYIALMAHLQLEVS
jgi:hypothetical protein